MRNPPRAGPTTVAISNALEFQVMAFGSARVGSRQGMMAVRAGQARMRATAIARSSRNISGRAGSSK